MIPVLPNLMQPAKEEQRNRNSFMKRCTVLSALLFVFLCSSATASHFKGGFFTYTYLGNGTYEFLITGYWHDHEVGNIFPRYEGRPKIHGFPLTVSKTLMKDGETVEHVQRQVVTWSNPGTYQVYWTTCCRAEGSNFSNNSMALYTAVNYNPEQPSSSPQFTGNRGFDFNSKQKINYTINMEDPEAHEQEYSLEIPYDLPATVYQEMLETGFQLKKDGTIVWKDPLEGSWLVSVKVHEKINGNYTGAYVLRDFIINVSPPGKRPDKAKRGDKAKARISGLNQQSAEPAIVGGVTVYPHPVQAVSFLTMTMKEAGMVKVEVLDMAGKLVQELYSGRADAGQELSLEINSKSLGADRLFIGRVTTPEGVHSFRLITR